MVLIASVFDSALLWKLGSKLGASYGLRKIFFVLTLQLVLQWCRSKQADDGNG